MKTKLSAKATRDERPPRTSKKKAPKHAPRVQCLRRPSPSEFSCGFDETRALLVEESLDERERRG